MVVNDDSDQEGVTTKDEFGNPFKDFGFVSRAEELKKSGNALFGAGNAKQAAAEYDAALQLLMTVSEDRAVIVGEKKWDQVVVLRSLLHLNKSACYCKLGYWREVVAEANACLLGNIPTETSFTHPHILADAKPSSIPEVDRRVTKSMRAKAWFRMSEGYLHLGYYARAQHAATKAMKVCEDEALRAKVGAQTKKIAALAKRATLKQKKAFQGYWSKLQRQQGGYVKSEHAAAGQTVVSFEGSTPEEKLRHLGALDGSDGDSDSDFEGFADTTGAAMPMLAWDGATPGLPIADATAADSLQKVFNLRQEEERSRMMALEARYKSSGKPLATKAAGKAALSDSD